MFYYLEVLIESVVGHIFYFHASFNFIIIIYYFLNLKLKKKNFVQVNLICEISSIYRSSEHSDRNRPSNGVRFFLEESFTNAG